MKIFLVLLFGGILPLVVYSQSGTSLGGIVLDRKVNVKDATVRIVSIKDPGISFTTQSDNLGEYRFSGFPEGTYRLQASSDASGSIKENER